MGLINPISGFNSSSEFTISGLPWVITASTSGISVVKYEFPKITKSITLHNLETSANKKIRVGFTANGVNGVNGNYYFCYDSGDLVVLDVRVKEIYIRADSSNTIPYSLYASLTMIDDAQMPILTGSIDGQTYWNGVG